MKLSKRLHAEYNVAEQLSRGKQKTLEYAASHNMISSVTLKDLLCEHDTAGSAIRSLRLMS